MHLRVQILFVYGNLLNNLRAKCQFLPSYSQLISKRSFTFYCQIYIPIWVAHDIEIYAGAFRNKNQNVQIQSLVENMIGGNQAWNLFQIWRLKSKWPKRFNSTRIFMGLIVMTCHESYFNRKFIIYEFFFTSIKLNWRK